MKKYNLFCKIGNDPWYGVLIVNNQFISSMGTTENEGERGAGVWVTDRCSVIYLPG